MFHVSIPISKLLLSLLEYKWMWYTFHEFMVVCRHMYIHFVNLIVTQQTGETPLHHAARSGNAKVVNALLTAGSKVDEKDKVSMLRKHEVELCTLHACAC